MKRRKFRTTLACRLHLHQWSCHNSRECKGDHHCLRCGFDPKKGEVR